MTSSRFAALVAFATSGLALAGPLTGGNAITDRAYVDSCANFTVADLNNVISATGLVTGWNVFADSKGAVELVIFRPSGNSLSIAGTSDLVTPVLGVNHFNLTHSIAVNKGDVVGLFLSSSAAVPFSLNECASVGLIRFTGSNSGLSSNFTGSANRVYSVNVAGAAATPEPSALAMFVLGMVLAGGFASQRGKHSA